MSDDAEATSSGTPDDDLAAALAEDPEAVAAFVRRLDDVNELLDVLALATEAADDEMVSSVAGTAGSLGELADEAADPETVRGARTLLRALGDAGDPETTYREVGALGLLRALRDPEVKRGLAFLVALARGIGRELER
ncbi:DUF1641 domain-containing protein [Haloplanus rubicundus]|uniref:DUF1641 domain-containing protein n=1 Tax=Haloplanus rubicundus TaxID=1547898 RepID=A0A345DZN1_9EURY|nr:DUF1641 domain-containing protein [Haloplanus rubicundus]AXG05403.1 DUF1641 domain-containing protein [Haloplanus rubicundus]AXG08758.1 DUF1641 domain-containing protein [Haloplanus rubicundus]